MREYILNEVVPIVLIAFFIGSANLFVRFKQSVRYIPEHRKIMVGENEIGIDYEGELNNISYFKDEYDNAYNLENGRIKNYYKNYDRFSLDDELDSGFKLEKIEDIKELFNVDLDNYKLQRNKTEYLYTKYINDIKTSEGIYVLLDENGTILKYESNNIGKFDRLKSNVTQDKVLRHIEEFDQIKDKSNYKLLDMMIDYEDHQYIVNCYIEDNNETKKIIYYI